MIQAHLSSTTITSNQQEAFSLHERSHLGEPKGELIYYSPVEALFLLKDKKMALFKGKKALSVSEYARIASRKDTRIEHKAAVFADLRKKGYVLKTALKFGADFRVYQKGARPGTAHAEWLLYCVGENESHSWHEFAAKNRIAATTKKKLMLAIVDDEDDIVYYEVSWMRP